MTSQDNSKRPRGKPGGRKPASSNGDSGARTAPAETGTQGAPERIAKILARAGIASRRDAERMVMEGRVSVNGTVLETPAVTTTLADRIEVDGMPIRGIERTRLWLYHKPAGLVTTNSDPEGRPTVFDNLPPELPRVLSIGRLDINTEGLLLLTNDGGLARVLELPATGWLRRYRVRAHGEIDQAALDRLKDGIAVDGVLYGAIEATLDRTQGSNVWLTMGLREGKNREIKNVLAALGLTVNRLIRISYGPFQLADLAEGNVREIRGRTLRDQLGPRLIADAGANFDAPVFDDTEPVPEPDAKSQPRAERQRPEKPSDKRERALARLDTRRADDGPKRRLGRRSRASNVWMAPGARPVAPKKAKAKADAEAADARRQEKRGSGRAGRPASKGERFDHTARKHGDASGSRRSDGAGRAERSAERPARDESPAGKSSAFRGQHAGRPNATRTTESFRGKPRGSTGPARQRPEKDHSQAGESGKRPRRGGEGSRKPAEGGKPFRKNSEPGKGRPRQGRPAGEGPRGPRGGRGGPRGADRRR